MRIDSFHKLALDAADYMGKNLGFKLTVTDLSGYAESRDDKKLEEFFGETM